MPGKKHWKETETAIGLGSKGHPHIVHVWAGFYTRGDREDAGRTVLVMHQYDGDMNHFLLGIRNAPNWPSFISARQILSIAVQVLSGLMFCHQSGVIHRDLKPGNGVTSPFFRLC